MHPRTRRCDPDRDRELIKKLGQDTYKRFYGNLMNTALRNGSIGEGQLARAQAAGVDVALLGEKLAEIDAIPDAAWLENLSERKRRELEFRDRDRTRPDESSAH